MCEESPPAGQKLPPMPEKPLREDGRANGSMFGISIRTNGDVLKFGVAAIAVAYAFKTGLQLAGVRDLLAGQITTGFVSVASLLGWVSTYVFRVGTKGTRDCFPAVKIYTAFVCNISDI
jgi:Protein of unknown function (DUF3007)